MKKKWNYPTSGSLRLISGYKSVLNKVRVLYSEPSSTGHSFFGQHPELVVASRLYKAASRSPPIQPPLKYYFGDTMVPIIE